MHVFLWHVVELVNSLPLLLLLVLQRITNTTTTTAATLGLPSLFFRSYFRLSWSGHKGKFFADCCSRFFTGWMPFLLPNEQHQTTEVWVVYWVKFCVIVVKRRVDVGISLCICCRWSWLFTIVSVLTNIHAQPATFVILCCTIYLRMPVKRQCQYILTYVAILTAIFQFSWVSWCDQMMPNLSTSLDIARAVFLQNKCPSRSQSKADSKQYRFCCHYSLCDCM